MHSLHVKKCSAWLKPGNHIRLGSKEWSHNQLRQGLAWLVDLSKLILVFSYIHSHNYIAAITNLSVRDE